MKKLVNLRLPVLFALALVAGIVFSAVLAFFGLDGIYISVPSLLWLIACAIYVGIRKRVARALIFCVALLFFLAGAIYMYCLYSSYCQSGPVLNEAVSISGRVREVGFTSTGGTYLVIGNATVGSVRINDKIIMYLSDYAGDYCRVGYDVSFKAELTKLNFFEYGGINYQAVKGVKYSCYVGAGLRSTYRFSLFGEIAGSIQNTLYSNLSPETAGVSFAMLTGNTDGISSGTLASFRQGGIAHVFAVSGLHIGVIYGALTFLFNKMRVNRYASTVVKIAFVAAYAGVCGFSPSSVRALICCSVSAISACTYRKYDSLNALAIAAIILLFINPLYLFGTGFVLSFSAMLGILLLSTNLKQVLGFLPKKLSGALAVGWSAQIATVPCLVSTFGYISAAGLFLNLIFIPLISFVYVIVFIGTLTGMIFPVFASNVLPVMCQPLELIINIVTFCGFEKSLISGDFDYLIYLPFILLTVGFTDKINLKLAARGVLVAFPLLYIVVSFTSNSVLAYGATASMTFNAGYSGGAVTVTTQEGTVLIVTDNYSTNKQYDGEDFSALVVVGGEDNLSVISSFGCSFNRAYVRGNAIQIPSLGHIPITYSDTFEVCGISFGFINDALVFTVDGVTAAVVRESDGQEYGAQLRNVHFNLYCYGSDGAVLYTGQKSYGLRTCGTMCYNIFASKILPAYVIPKE